MGKIDQMAEFLLNARNCGTTAREILPAGLKPENIGEAYAIQHEVCAGLGAIGGWKVLAQGEDHPLLATAVPISMLRASGARLDAGADPEIRVVLAVRLAASLASWNAPFTIAEAEAAIETIHPAAELLQSRIGEASDPLAFVADSLSAGPLVVGRSTRTWRGFDPAGLAVTVRIGRQTSRHEGHAELNIPRLLLWLAEYGATWANGPLVGHVVEVGIGLEPMRVPVGTAVRVAIDGLGRLDFRVV